MRIDAATPNFTALNAAPKPQVGEAELKETFRDFAAGIVFGQMLKAMRKLHGEASYMNGGQAEKTFRSMMDQKVAEQMASEHGAAIADPLFESFRGRIPIARPADAETPAG